MSEECSPDPVHHGLRPSGEQRQQLREHGRSIDDFELVEGYMRRRTGRPDQPFPVNVIDVLIRAPRHWDAGRIISGLDSARGTPKHWDWFRCAIESVRRAGE